MLLSDDDGKSWEDAPQDFPMVMRNPRTGPYHEQFQEEDPSFLWQRWNAPYLSPRGDGS